MVIHDNSLIFLDIDGVLNTHDYLDDRVMCGTFHHDKVDLLNKVLLETDAKVVLSSAWRYLVHRGDMALSGIDWLLRSHGIYKERLIGITRKDKMIQDYSDVKNTWPITNERGQQIADWLKENPQYNGRYVVVDDLDLGITESGHPFVHTNGQIGLT